MSKFAIGRMVMAVGENDVSDAYFHPVGSTVKSGQTGVIDDGPDRAWNGGMMRTHWGVTWADGRKTWSAQEALMVIDDPDAKAEDETEAPATLQTA